MPHIQIRNVPPELHRRLKSRAAERGLTLSDYLLQTVELVAERPTMEEFVARARALARHDPAESSADAVQAERDRP